MLLFPLPCTGKVLFICFFCWKNKKNKTDSFMSLRSCAYNTMKYHILWISLKLSISQFGELNWQFHACLYQAAKRPTLFSNIANLHQLCSRSIGFHSVELNYVKTSQQEHYQLLEAIRAKQLGKAKAILKQHIAEAGEILVTYLHKNMHV